MIDQTTGFSSTGATLELGVERVPLAWDSGGSADELIQLLGR